MVYERKREIYKTLAADVRGWEYTHKHTHTHINTHTHTHRENLFSPLYIPRHLILSRKTKTCAKQKLNYLPPKSTKTLKNPSKE